MPKKSTHTETVPVALLMLEVSDTARPHQYLTIELGILSGKMKLKVYHYTTETNLHTEYPDDVAYYVMAVLNFPETFDITEILSTGYNNTWSHCHVSTLEVYINKLK